MTALVFQVHLKHFPHLPTLFETQPVDRHFISDPFGQGNVLFQPADVDKAADPAEEHHASALLLAFTLSVEQVVCPPLSSARDLQRINHPSATMTELANGGVFCFGGACPCCIGSICKGSGRYSAAENLNV
jgi:hypothetical protein